MTHANATRAAARRDIDAKLSRGTPPRADLLPAMGSGMAQPEEFNAVIAYLYGELLYGLCRLVHKALEVCRV